MSQIIDRESRQFLAMMRERAAYRDIAAELAEALEWALNQIDDDLDPDHQAALEQARATLNKAKGKS